MSDFRRVLACLLLAACAHRASPSAPSAGSQSPPGKDVAAATTFALPVEPNGLWWDAPSSTLYFASDEQHAVYRWRDGVFTIAAALPAPAGKPGLGQLVRTSDGRTVVPRFGHGDGGGIVVVARDGSTATLTGLDATRRRIGLTLAADGTLYDSYFVYEPTTHVAHGGVARLALGNGSGGGTGGSAAGEVDVVVGLHRPVGVLVIGDALYVSDQEADAILRVPLSTPGEARPFAQLSQPDLLCAGDAGAIFAATKSGGVYRIAPDGQVARVVAGWRSLRGIAWDGAGKRLFVVERHGKDATEPPTLHVLAPH